MDYGCYNDYYNEYDPIRRKRILDSLVPGEGTQQDIEQMRTLFALRYKQNRKGVYVDHFLNAVLTFRMISYHSSNFNKRQNRKEVDRAAHKLCLDRAEEFDLNVFCREMCNALAQYVSDSLADSRYTGIVFGSEGTRANTSRDKVEQEFGEIRDLLETYLENQRGCLIFLRAMGKVEKAML